MYTSNICYVFSFYRVQCTRVLNPNLTLYQKYIKSNHICTTINDLIYSQLVQSFTSYKFPKNKFYFTHGNTNTQALPYVMLPLRLSISYTLFSTLHLKYMAENKCLQVTSCLNIPPVIHGKLNQKECVSGGTYCCHWTQLLWWYKGAHVHR